MLTDNEKTIVRMLIARRPDVSYMAQLAASDDFARAEIAKFKPMLLKQVQDQKAAADKASADAISKIAILS